MRTKRCIWHCHLSWGWQLDWLVSSSYTLQFKQCVGWEWPHQQQQQRPASEVDPRQRRLFVNCCDQAYKCALTGAPDTAMSAAAGRLSINCQQQFDTGARARGWDGPTSSSIDRMPACTLFDPTILRKQHYTLSLCCYNYAMFAAAPFGVALVQCSSSALLIWPYV